MLYPLTASSKEAVSAIDPLSQAWNTSPARGGVGLENALMSSVYSRVEGVSSKTTAVSD